MSDGLADPMGTCPAWALHPPAEHFVGVSLGNEASESLARDNAMLSARKEIADALGVELSREQVETITSAGDASGILDASISSVARTEALAGALLQVSAEEYCPVSATVQDGPGVRTVWKCYVLVPFSADEHADYWREVSEVATARARAAFGQAESEFAVGNQLGGIRRYGEVVRCAAELTGLKGMPQSGLLELHQLESEARQRIMDFPTAIRSVAHNATQTCPLGEIPAEPLVLELWTDCEGVRQPLAGVPVAFTAVGGCADLDDAPKTGSDGRAVCRVRSVSATPGECVVRARPEFGSLGLVDDETDMFITTSAPGGVFAIAVAPLSLSLSVETECPHHDRAAAVFRSRLAEAMREQGCAILDPTGGDGSSADWVLHASVVCEDAGHGGYGDPNVHCCVLSLNVQARRQDDPAKQFSLILPDGAYRELEGWGLSERRAVEDALELDREKDRLGVTGYEYIAREVQAFMTGGR